MKPIAIVTPWFGKDLTGGAEQQAWQLANRFSSCGICVEVLTTCCKSFFKDWESNDLRPGKYIENNFIIRRFRVDLRDRLAFDSINRSLLSIDPSLLTYGCLPLSKTNLKLFTTQNINSKALLSYLDVNKYNYSSFLFIPYLYGPILNGLPIVSELAFLQPCLHDEAYAYLPDVESTFRRAKGIFFNSDGELRLAQRLYGPGILQKSIITGEGVEVRNTGNHLKQIGALNIADSRYILYLGRRDSTKNVNILVDAFKQFKLRNPDSDLLVVLAGPGSHSYYDSTNGVIDLGFVKEAVKNSLLNYCIALFQPSRNESYSRVMMEAWFYKKPVAAHSECLATSTAVLESGGGFIAASENEWLELFSAIDKLPSHELDKYGEKGNVFALKYANWDNVIDRYKEILWSKQTTKKVRNHSMRLTEIHQVLPNLTYGDAISNHAISIRNYLQSKGYKSNIFVRYIDQKIADEAVILNSTLINKNAGIFYHHSVGSELTQTVTKHIGPKCLIYHNITPPEFFKPYRPDYAKILEKGKDELLKLSSTFKLSAGISAYNIVDLRKAGFSAPFILPIAVSPEKWNFTPDSRLMEQLQDGTTNLLFVGRIAPNKCQDHLVRSFFEYVSMDSNARLILVGGGDPNDPYYRHLRNLVRDLGLIKHVVMTGLISEAALCAYYRTAHLFWSMSEHEGFCVPVIEAMWFDVPVLAFKSSAVPETLGKSGIMFTDKKDLLSIAAMAKLLVHDDDIRSKVLKSQRKRRIDFLPENIWPELDKIIDNMARL